MGTILGQKKAPERQVSSPASVSSAPAPEPTTTSSSSTPSNSNDVESSPEKQREKNLLNRSRGTVGTVVTGFRGILAPSNTSLSTPRKTLLGE